MSEVRMDRLRNEADLLDVLGPTYRADAAELAATYRWAAAEILRLDSIVRDQDAEVDRLTAALNEAVVSMLDMCDEADAAEAREKALRAITQEMLDLHGDGLVSWVRVCNEWDRRAGEVT
jgi:signal transduction protein with GAF and PtsI domain